MNWVYLSPHFDDAVYSCGGLIWEQTRAGDTVEIRTICAGEPQPGPLPPFAAELHERWGSPQAVSVRRQEDQDACQIVGARRRLFAIPDCIYRTLPDGEPVVHIDEDLFTVPLEREMDLVRSLAAQLRSGLPARARVVVPLALGGHVDHRLVRAAAEMLGLPLRYYADFPYVAREQPDIPSQLPPGVDLRLYPVSEQGLAAWQRAVAAHRSQISTFWASEADLYADMEAYWRSIDGNARLWEPYRKEKKVHHEFHE